MARRTEPGRTHSRGTAWLLAVLLLALVLPTPVRADGAHAIRPVPPVPAECGVDGEVLLPMPQDAVVASRARAVPLEIVVPLPPAPADGPGFFHFIAAGRDTWSTTLPPPSIP